MSEQPAAPAVPSWDVADRMRKSLRHARVGVAEMADYLDVSRTSVSNWINGRVLPSTQTLRLWALRTGVPFEWLRDGKSAQVREAFMMPRSWTFGTFAPLTHPVTARVLCAA